MKRIFHAFGIIAVTFMLATVVFAFIAAPQAKAAAVYYMAPNGSDSNSGTLASPWKTLAYASTKLGPGDTLYLRGGMYSHQYMYWTESGTENAPITVMAYPGETPVFDGFDPNYPGDPSHQSGNPITVNSSQWLIFDGLTFQNSVGAAGIWVGRQAETDAITSNIVIRNCKFLNLGIDFNDHGVYISQGASNIDVYNNYFSGIPGAGVHMYHSPGGSNYHIYNNVFNGGGRWGILVGDDHNDTYIYNNTFFNNERPIQVGQYGSPIHHVVIENNVFYSSSGRSLMVYTDEVNEVTEDYNLYYDTTTSKPIQWGYTDVNSSGSGYSVSDLQANTTNGVHSLQADPSFVNAAGNDFRLNPDSPAIDRGVAIPEITADNSGTLRPIGPAYDMGAFEYNPNAPLNATIAPASAVFDKNVSMQSDLNVDINPNGNDFRGIRSGSNTLVPNNDYTVVSDTQVVIKKAYLAAQPLGTTTLLFDFSGGASVIMTVQVKDTTPVSASLQPASSEFDRNGEQQSDIAVNLIVPGGLTFVGVSNGSTQLAQGSDYTVMGNIVTIRRQYLATLRIGTANLTFDFDGGTDPVLTIDISDSSLNLLPNPSFEDGSAAPAGWFAYKSGGGTASWDNSLAYDGSKSIRLDGTIAGSSKAYYATLSRVPVLPGMTYSLNGYYMQSNVPTAHRAFLKVQWYRSDGSLTGTASSATLPAGTVTGWTQTRITAVTPSDAASAAVYAYLYNTTGTVWFDDIELVRVADPKIAPTTASFDRDAANPEDITINTIPNGYKLNGIRNGTYVLVSGKDYTVTGDSITLNKYYLNTLPLGDASLIFDFSGGTDPSLTVHVTDSAWYTAADWASGSLKLGTANTGRMSVEFDLTPLNAKVNGTIGYADSSANIHGWSSSAMIIAMDRTQGYFTARNGNVYDCLTKVFYANGTVYHFRIVPDFAAKTYSVYVTPQGGTEAMIASGYAFRSDAPVTDDLGQISLKSDVGYAYKIENHTVLVDNVAPVTSDNAPKGWMNRDAAVQLTAVDSGSGVAATYYSLDGSAVLQGSIVNIAEEGSHSISYWSVDNVGNEEAKHTIQILIDKSSPTTRGTASEPDGRNGWYVSDPAVTLSADDALSGVAHTDYRINGGPWVTYSEPVVISTEGTTILEYKSTDIAGNEEAVNSMTIRLDKTAPTLQVHLDKSLLWPPNHKLVNIQASVSASDSVSSIDSVALTSIVSNEPDYGKEDGDQPGDIQNADYGTSDTDFDLRAERNGNGSGRIYTVTYTATDEAGNLTEASATVVVPHDQSGN